MSSIIEHYKILGIGLDAAFSDITSSYRRLCRIHHPDISGDPKSEEIMKRINIAYTVVREKFLRESAMRERFSAVRQRRYGADTRSHGATTRAKTAETRTKTSKTRKAAGAEREAFAVLDAYFAALSNFDYIRAYGLLSSRDKSNITSGSFVSWRKSVARLHPIREFKIIGGFPIETVSMDADGFFYARRFQVVVTEGDNTEDLTRTETVEKLVVYDGERWKVFLGYEGLAELTRSFDERFEAGRIKHATRRREEIFEGLDFEYDMLSLAGLRKAALREIYRQRRYSGPLTFAVISVKSSFSRADVQWQLLNSAAKTISKSLRETDVCAYLDDGVFALLLVQSRKKYALEIIDRITSKIRENAGNNVSAGARIEHAYCSWSRSGSASIDGVNTIMKKFGKKIH